MVVPRRRYSATELVLASDSKKNTGKQKGYQPNKQQEENSKEERKQGAPPQRLTLRKIVGTGRQHKDEEAQHEINQVISEGKKHAPIIMEAHHKTEKESCNNEVIHASLQVSKHKAATWAESPPLIAKEEEMIPR